MNVRCLMWAVLISGAAGSGCGDGAEEPPAAVGSKPETLSNARSLRGCDSHEIECAVCITSAATVFSGANPGLASKRDREQKEALVTRSCQKRALLEAAGTIVAPPSFARYACIAEKTLCGSVCSKANMTAISFCSSATPATREAVDKCVTALNSDGITLGTAEELWAKMKALSACL